MQITRDSLQVDKQVVNPGLMHCYFTCTCHAVYDHAYPLIISIIIPQSDDLQLHPLQLHPLFLNLEIHQLDESYPLDICNTMYIAVVKLISGSTDQNSDSTAGNDIYTHHTVSRCMP